MLGRPLLCILAGILPAFSQVDGPAFFEKNIRPILVKQCLACHSATSQPIMGSLRLDTREMVLKGGSRGPSITPGNPAESLLLKAVLHTAGALKMPPGPKMKDADLAMLAQWIEMGAPWGNPLTTSAAPKTYWAFIKPTMPKTPELKNATWAKSPIDAFLLKSLEAKGLSPAPPADKRTLIRRATYDLIGLPPTPVEVQSFLADNSPQAYPNLIDRLLASPRYGERWGRHWLDVARYADSNGLDENLVYKNAFRYRDYVIAAFNKDKPYDQFLTEQLAGDLLPESSDLQTTFERWTATGFLSLGAKMLAEDDPKKMEMDIVDEQLDTTARAFMGMTVGCARCHDHKFDPIPTADYYGMAGIFKSSKTMENFKVVAKWHEYVLAPKEQRDQLAAHEAKIEAKRKEISAITKSENDTLTNDAKNHVGAYLLASARLQHDQEIRIAPVETSSQGISLASPPKNDGKTIDFSFDIPKAGQYQLDILDQERGAGTADIFVNGTWVLQGLPPVQNRAASPETPGWTYLAIVQLQRGKNTIRMEHASKFPKFDKLLLSPHTAKETPLTPVQIAALHKVNPTILEQLMDFFDRSQGAPASALYEWETKEKTPALAAQYESKFQQALRDKDNAALKPLLAFLEEKFGPFRAPANARRYYSEAAKAKLKVFDEELKTLEKATPDFPKAMGVTEGDQIADTQIHTRGSHWTLGETVPRHFLSVIDGKKLPEIGDKTSGRLQLAQWLTQPDHPLTSRVMVNRIWRNHFGRGIVPSVDNFGRLGEAPTNQPLLDYLALRFIENKWSIKAMHREMMLTNAYQMSSTLDAKANEADPENVLLWRFPRRRLEAEAIRDGVMSSSGELTTKMGGTILDYKDRAYVANTSKGGSVDYDRPIRSVYVPVVRSSMYEVFSAFDLPDPTMSNGDRDATVVAPQALFMMNSSVILIHSRKMADSLLADQTLDNQGRIRQAYERALSRPPTAQEIDQALTFLGSIEKDWKGDNAKAWQSFCKSLLATNEFIYLN
ncbi:DUF1553 domain-containing protein [Bryobacter aggregatus]|uniref:DUF1553 domain-containing protein n=1 Tax=Bryobacter aggregatus TaxID=360054 RepID=UPI000692038A|nr:DUF1553 domain-containing protein [Bryobacter aggregatus]